MSVRLRDFEEAVDVWTTVGMASKSCDGPDVRPFIKHWLGPECTLLAFARAERCRFSDGALAKFRELQNCQHDQRQLVVFYRGVEGIDDRILAQIECLIHAVEAGRCWQNYLNNGPAEDEVAPERAFDRAVLSCIAAYARAFPLGDDLLGGSRSLGVFVDADADQLLRHRLLETVLQATDRGEPIATSAYLAAQRLLEYLLQEPVKRDQVPTQGTILCVAELERENRPEGMARTVDFVVSVERVTGFFLDPVSLGLTAIGLDMIQSLLRAWNNEQLAIKLSEPGPILPTTRAIRVSPDTTGIRSLSGESAAVVFACGMCAAAHQVKLDAKTTASATLDPANPGKVLAVAKESLPAKFAAAKDAGIERIILEKSQEDKFRDRAESLRLPLIGVSSLAEAWQQMTKKTADEQRMEQVLIAYGDAVAKRWDDLLKGIKDDGLGLSHYVEPHYGLLPVHLKPMYLRRQIGWQVDEANKHREDLFRRQPLDQVLKASHRLCLMEDAGTGKSVFTRMVEALACRPEGWEMLTDGRPCLAVRWEQHWPGQHHGDVVADLVRHIHNYCGEGVRAEDVVKYAIEHGRVVLILDALDQVRDAGRTLTSLAEFLESEPGTKCRVILTSRYYEVPKWDEHLFHDPAWRFARIEGFDERQQHEYLRGLYRDSLDELVPDRENVADLMKIPIVLHMIRESAVPGQPLGFRHRGDLYLQATRRMIERAIEKAPIQHAVFSRDDADRLERILAAGAFTMMVQQNYEYAVWGKDPVSEFRDQVLARYGDPAIGGLWSMVKTATDLTERSLLEVCREDLLGFRHRGMMEFYCGLYLAKYSSERCVAEMRRFANDPQWYWAWRFAIELPKAVPRVETWCRSLGLLFERPATGTRPTELMYRAWPALLQAAKYLTGDAWEDRDLFRATRRAQVSARWRVRRGRENSDPDPNPARELVLRFLGEFWRLCANRSSDAGQIATQLLPRGTHVRGLWGGESLWDGENHLPKLKPGKIRNFIKCPAGVFTMGRPWERHEVELSDFLMQTTLVTVAQYCVFDPQHECPGSDNCPVTEVSWYDAWVFALWAGGLLPTEAQWEYACRAETETDYSFGDDAGQLGKYGWYNGNSGGKAHPVATCLANPWGLYDMHGNVWEWCWDWYGEYERTKAENPTGPLGGSYRVYRGGGWHDDASGCRSAYRDRYDDPCYRCDVPGYRYGFSGFRLARAVSLCPAR